MQPRILTVLRSGGEYEPWHVERLREQCEVHAPRVPFVCLSDVDVPCERIEMMHDWPGWWCKMEMLRFPGPWLYLDLDTTIVGGLWPFLSVASRYPFAVLRDFNPQCREIGSGLMAWNGDMSGLYATFRAAPARHMRENSGGRWLGDQGFIERQTGADQRHIWQDELPGMVVSYKKHCRKRVPDDARIVCFHGQPRPWSDGVTLRR